MGSELEWELIKKHYGNRCATYGSTEHLEKAHIVARSRGGDQLIPLCHDCHREYDSGKLGWIGRWKLGVDDDKYKKGQYGPR